MRYGYGCSSWLQLMVNLFKLSTLTTFTKFNLRFTNDGYRRIHSPHVQDVIQFGSVHLFVSSDSCLGIT